MLTLVKPFEAYCLIKAHDETADGERFIYAPIHAADQKDMDGDILTKGSLISGLRTHQQLGAHVDYAHMYARTQDPKWLVGNGLPDAPEIDGIPNLVTRLLKGKYMADQVWDHLLTKGVMGYSLQGAALASDPSNHKRVTNLIIKLVTVDPAPKSGAITHLKMGAPPLLGLSALSKSFDMQLASGDLEGWGELEEDEADLYLPDSVIGDSPAFGWSLPALQKAITVGSGPAGPDSTGGTAALRESIIGNREERQERQERQERRQQNRCPACDKKNHEKRTQCRACGCSLGPKKAARR